MKEKDNKKGLSVAISVGIIVLLLVAIGDIVVNYVPLKEIFSKNVKYVTEKEVTVTDTGIRDAVSKLYNASVIVEVGSTKDKLSGWGSGFVYKKIVNMDIFSLIITLLKVLNILKLF